MDRVKTRKAKTRLDKIIGNNIRIERELRNITRDEFAGVAELTVSHLGLIERGARGATSVTIEKVVAAFGITIDSLFAERSKNMSPMKKSKIPKDVYGEKIATLITPLSEPELELIVNIIKDVIAMRTAMPKNVDKSEKETPENKKRRQSTVSK